MAVLMDGLGYNAFWMAEHHFQREGTECIPNVLMMALHLTHVTKNLKIGCGFNIAPMWHPLRLAEDYAMADILTNGRVIFGLGRGYHTREVETFGSPLTRPGGQPRAVRGTGRHHLQGVQRGVVQPQGQALHAAAGGAVSRLHAEGADAGAAAAAPAGGMLAADPGRHRRARWSSWPSTASRAWSAAARPRAARCTRWCWAGRKRTPRWASTSNSASGCASASTSTWATARRTASSARAKYYEENMKMFGELRLVRAMTDEQIEIMRDPKRAPTAKLPRIEDAVNAGGFLTGNATGDHRPPEGAGGEISGAGPDLRQPVGRRAEVRGAGAVAALRRGGDAGVQEDGGATAGTGQVEPGGPLPQPPPARGGGDCLGGAGDTRCLPRGAASEEDYRYFRRYLASVRKILLC